MAANTECRRQQGTRRGEGEPASHPAWPDHGLADVLRRLRYLQPGLCDPFRHGPVGSCQGTGGTSGIERPRRLPDRRGRARHRRRSLRASRDVARRPLDHQRLHAGDACRRRLLCQLLRHPGVDRARARRAAAAGDDLHQRAGAAPSGQHVFAVGRGAGMGRGRHLRRHRRRFPDAGLRLAGAVLDRLAVDPAHDRAALHPAGIGRNSWRRGGAPKKSRACCRGSVRNAPTSMPAQISTSRRHRCGKIRSPSCSRPTIGARR